jgi:hypothetical protein
MNTEKPTLRLQMITTQETIDNFNRYVDIANNEEGMGKSQLYNIMVESFSSGKALHNLIMKRDKKIGLKEAVNIAERIMTSPDFHKLLDKHFGK